MSKTDTPRKLIAVQGTEAQLYDVGNGMGIVVRDGKESAPEPIARILKWGYWRKP